MVILRHIVLMVCMFVSCGVICSDSFCQESRHIVAYGGIQDKHLKDIGRNCSILITDILAQSQAKTLKMINPKMVILKYHDAVSINRGNPDWSFINANEGWFVHSGVDNTRLTNKKFKAFLMNISREDWRAFRVSNIVKGTPGYFDGVFLDDCFDRYSTHFVDGKLPREKSVVMHWSSHMSAFLIGLRKVYNKLIIINGPFERYLPYVDGCMEENFVHSNLDSDAFYHTPSYIIRLIEKVELLKRKGKLVLLQSGTIGDAKGDPEKIFNYCLSAYFMVASEKTSFGFQPVRGYYHKGLPRYLSEKGPPLGTSREPYEIDHKLVNQSNLLNNGDFRKGFNSWKIRSGMPQINVLKPSGKMTAYISGNGGQSNDYVESEFVPVSPGRDYTIMVWCKSEMNIPGNAQWKKLGLQGRFFDANKKQIYGAYDMQLDSGSYDWLPFEATYTSPKDARFFKLGIGFLGDGSGKAWVRDIYFGEVNPNSFLMKRKFSNGRAFFNPGPRRVIGQFPSGGLEPSSFAIEARSGKFLRNE